MAAAAPRCQVQSSVGSGSERPPVGQRVVPVVVGVSYRNSSIAYRERLDRLLDARDWTRVAQADEWALVRTCNRIEFVLATSTPAAAAERLSRWVRKELGQTRFYVLEGHSAIAHLFRVASGLDSMIVNEGQILDQLRAAGRQARMAGSSKAVLSPLFDAAVSAGAAAKSTLKGGSDSVASLGLALAIKKLGHKPNDVLLVGTGKMSKIAAAKLQGSRIHVVSKRSNLPSSLRLVPERKIRDVLRRCELVVCATNHRGYAIDAEDVGDSKKKRVIVDLAFPRNVDPSVRSNPGVELLDLDDIARYASRLRFRGTSRAERLVEQEASRFEIRLKASRLSPELPALFRWAEAMRSKETDAALRRLGRLSPRDRRIVEALGRRITSKMLAKPAAFVKSSSQDLPQEERMRLLRAVFMEG